MSTLSQHVAYIGLGANLGNTQYTVQEAIVAIKHTPRLDVLAVSHLYLSEPIDATGEDYVNAVMAIQTPISPHALLNTLQDIENTFGRKRPYHHAPRTLDIDILLYDNLIMKTDSLTLPHPHMHQRAFVMYPLLEIHPDIDIPGIGLAQHVLPSLTHQKIVCIHKGA